MKKIYIDKAVRQIIDEGQHRKWVRMGNRLGKISIEPEVIYHFLRNRSIK